MYRGRTRLLALIATLWMDQLFRTMTQLSHSQRSLELLDVDVYLVAFDMFS